MITIFTYNRLDMLRQTVGECAGKDSIQVIDDESEYLFSVIQSLGDLLDTTVYRFQHCGKENFYKLWDFALHNCEESGDQRFLFLPDDYSNIDFERIEAIHNHFVMSSGYHKPYVCNLVNDGRPPQWGAPEHMQYNDDLELVGWVDCGFFCNRAALDYHGYDMGEVDKARFKVPGRSSGVGEQMSRRFRHAGVPMLRPYKSLAFHGEHESVMHPEERIKNPLKSN